MPEIAVQRVSHPQPPFWQLAPLASGTRFLSTRESACVRSRIDARESRTTGALPLLAQIVCRWVPIYEVFFIVSLHSSLALLFAFDSAIVLRSCDPQVCKSSPVPAKTMRYARCTRPAMTPIASLFRTLTPDGDFLTRIPLCLPSWAYRHSGGGPPVHAAG
jgi:hypothetical protein